MLGKLLKHEFKATGRHFLLMYAFFIFVTICNKIILEITANNDFWQMFQGLFMGAYILTCAAIFVLTTVLVIMRFYKNMLSDEGYLMFTLPVTVSQHITAKAIVAYVWTTLSTIIFLLSILMLVSGHGVYDVFYEIMETITIASTEFGGKFWACVIIYGIAMLVGNAYTILQYYMSMAIGQLVNKHRILASFGAYFGLNFVLQNVLSIGFLALSLFNPSFAYMETEAEFAVEFFNYMNTIGIISLIVNVLFSVAFFIVTKVILTKKLNLE